MMRQYELVERVTSYDPEADEDMLNKAYVYAMKAHGHQVRASGDPYFTHPLEVAAILTDMKLDDATIAAALLHDVVEDTEATHQEIEDLFGPEISGLVEGLTKIKRLDLISKEAAQAENLRKLLLAMARDARVLLVKLADRLHNMRTLNHVKPEKRARIARETMDIYAPLAGRMGMHAIREELDDISFEALYPEAREGIIKRLETLRAESGDILANIEERLTEQFAQAGIAANVTGREKKPCSIWRKMQRKDLSLGQLSDIFGFRVIVGDIADCYRALGVVHTTWRVVPGRFKDYISNPKQNDYRSIHTTIIGPHRKRVELQIRTAEMDEIAERGVAAHSFLQGRCRSDGGRARSQASARRLQCFQVVALAC
jgi:guanosine-3',5'-bis(diphosphate) 3'-pyrophosphohydrolase